MSKSRMRNSALNITAGILYQLLMLLLNFASRTIFIRILGVEYLGINGLFTNILSVLSLAELGVGSAIVYSMYKHLAEDDKTKLTALINYYKKLYNTIAAVIAVVGLALVPFLDYLVNLETPIESITLYYILFLANSVMSYLFVYRTSIATADQKSYKLKVYNMAFALIQFTLQIIVLLTTHNYVLYIIVQIFCALSVNIICTRKTVQLYPFIKGKEQLQADDKREIWSNIKSLFLYQIGGVVLNNTDNILISVILGTIWVGYYSNYSMIIAQIGGFTSIIFVSLQASIGNLNAEGDAQKQFFIFKVLNLVSFWAYGFCAVCFCILFQDFITLWLGSSFLVDMMAVYMAVATFYLQGVLYPIWCYRQTTGLFKHTKYTMFFASIINLGLSIWWGYEFGLVGILAATVVARLATNIWYEPYKLHKLFFGTSPKKYYINQMVNIVLLISVIALVSVIATGVPVYNPIVNFTIKMLICVIVPNGIFFLIFRKTDEFKYLYDKSLKKVLNKIHK